MIPPGAGTVIDGRYRLLGRIGRGATSEIWRADDQDGGRTVAVKLLHPSLAHDPELLARFRQELESTRRIVHPNVVRVLGGGRSVGGTAYLVMDEVLGRQLSQVAATEAPLDPHRVANIGRQVAAGLGAAHAQGVVHRDLKPENVLIHRTDAGDGVVLFDFGFAGGEFGASITGHDVRIGTAGYMAPEYTARGAFDERSDLYALGVVLYELAAGEMPFLGPPSKVFRAQATRPAPPLAERCSAPGWLCGAVDHLLQRSPEERTPTAERAIAELTPP
ncbi:MAG: serine/threonine-protein kinase [Myxococcota bacterium]